jgi:hypothetical protein
MKETPTMTALTMDPNIANPDDFYARLLAAHEGRSKAESDAINARLVLILANHIGDAEVLDSALTLATDA